MGAPESAVSPATHRSGGRSWLGLAAVVMATAVALLSVVLATGAGPTPLLRGDDPFVLTPVGSGCATAVAATCWLILTDQPSSAFGLALVLLAWLLPGLAAWPALSADLRAELMSASPLAVAGCVLVVAGWRSRAGWLPPAQLAAIGLAFAAASAQLLGYNPFLDPACWSTCEAAPAPLASAFGARDALAIAVGMTVLAALATVAIGVAARPAPLAVRGAASTAAILVAISVFLHWWRWGNIGDVTLQNRLVTVGTLGITAAAALVSVRTRQVRRNVRDVVTQLSNPAPAVGATAGAVIAVQFAVPHEHRWVDSTGRELPSVKKQPAVVLNDSDGPALRLILSQRADAGQVASSITPAQRLALENARLRAVGFLRLTEVRASQRRIVELGDVERGRIERDLHDGAQQRLVAVMMHLSSARQRFGGADVGALAAGEAHVKLALAGLRALSHDSLAAVLTAEGLSAAVDDLVASSSLRIDLQQTFQERTLSGPVQTTAYLTIRSALDNVAAHAGVAQARVTLVETGGALVASIVDRGCGGAWMGPGLSAVADRVGALGGHLTITSTPADGTTVTAELPCGS